MACFLLTKMEVAKLLTCFRSCMYQYADMGRAQSMIWMICFLLLKSRAGACSWSHNANVCTGGVSLLWKYRCLAIMCINGIGIKRLEVRHGIYYEFEVVMLW
jgi:hypothetical protein